jgi:preprotein translocase subunit SecA
LRQQVTSVLSHVELRVPQPAFAEAMAGPEEEMAEARATGTTGRAAPNRPRAPRRGNGSNGGEPLRPGAAPRAPWAGTPRNAPCPCGSGRKFKHCHGRV